MRTFVLAGLFCCVAACGKDRGQTSAEAAKADVQRLVDLTAKDVAEVEHGLPDGAKKLDVLLAKELGKDDPRSNVPGVRSALLKMRQQVPELGIAKSTFFAYTDAKGVAVRNDYEQDTMGGKDLVARWPGLGAALKDAPFASTSSPTAETGAGGAAEKDWAAAVPVKKADGTLEGLLVTGWSYRRFAYHLQVTLQREVQEDLMRSAKGKMPILFVCLFDKDHTYCANAPGAIPIPAVDEKALQEAGLWAKTEAGVGASALKITDRDFGWAATRLPKLGPDVGVVVLRSELL
jgi:hypothetical protein